jgi:LPXTG-motif cell wall-anchored protein
MMSLLPRPLSEEESVRKRAWVLVVAMAMAFLLVGGAGALGQPKAQGWGQPYAYDNGMVIIGGDIGVTCRMFLSKEFYPSDARGEAKAQAERALEQCEQDGYVTLPETGGGSLTLLAAGVLLLCAGLGLVAIHRTA